MKKSFLLLLAGAFTFLLLTSESCESEADREQRQQTNRLMEEANAKVGMPDIANFKELEDVKMLYELRDRRDLTTYVYIHSMDGTLTFLCTGIGYGLPYSAQSTNPQKRIYSGSDVTLPQAEPNGLFMPDGLSATWVMCLDPNDGTVKPLYVEPTIIVSPFPLKSKESYYAKREEIIIGLAEISRKTSEALRNQ